MSKRSRANNEQSLEVLAAQFEYASVAVITIGNILATISAGITLRLLEETSSSSSKSTNSNLFNFEAEQMQRQMDELIGEMQNLKRMMQR
ncbi:hypothetical protein LZ480_05945 [Solibacillus sp. MA9]|uniref:Translation initiation factor 2 n=1 Tax=Solibacillus palustris TaxID=2908203 RepID=A0ABS9UAR1_9BACL|nr:hypothetical protein [Solibacillus sp. MA9]MCH7321431.1 hypothetical protein [Solibacillus sp. MA9]